MNASPNSVVVDLKNCFFWLVSFIRLFNLKKSTVSFSDTQILSREQYRSTPQEAKHTDERINKVNFCGSKIYWFLETWKNETLLLLN